MRFRYPIAASRHSNRSLASVVEVLERSSGQQNLALAREQEGFQDYLSAGTGRGRKRHFVRFDGLANALDVLLIARLGRIVVGLVGENEREDALGDEVAAVDPGEAPGYDGPDAEVEWGQRGVLPARALPVVVPAHDKGTI